MKNITNTIKSLRVRKNIFAFNSLVVGKVSIVSDEFFVRKLDESYAH